MYKIIRNEQFVKTNILSLCYLIDVVSLQMKHNYERSTYPLKSIWPLHISCTWCFGKQLSRTRHLCSGTVSLHSRDDNLLLNAATIHRLHGPLEVMSTQFSWPYLQSKWEADHSAYGDEYGLNGHPGPRCIYHYLTYITVMSHDRQLYCLFNSLFRQTSKRSEAQQCWSLWGETESKERIPLTHRAVMTSSCRAI